ncbi:MAG: hypothetical protein D6809_04730 [Gammaproteobacteria bacterium]|nr:MAG: hypothetical protein D6809_04730 [Gammaproteobacteria bacterium]
MQAGAAPFAAALLLALLLGRLGRLGSGLALLGGWALGVQLAVGWRLLPLSASRKLLLVALAAAALGLLLELRPALARPRRLSALAAAVGLASAGWVLWPLLARGALEPLPAVAAGLYAAWLPLALLALRGQPVRVLVALAAAAAGTGAAALLGASALLGQLALAAAAAASGVLVPACWGRVQAPALLGLLPLGLAVALAGVEGVAYARLPWPALLPVAAAPMLATVPAPEAWSRPVRLLWILLWPGLAAAAAGYWAWRQAGGLPW